MTSTSATMTGAEFRAIRERLGLDVPWLAKHLKVGKSNAERYDSGWRVDRQAPVIVPARIAVKVRALLEHTDHYVDSLVADCQLRMAAGALATITVYHTDAEYAAAAAAGHVPEGMPARWHRACAYRATEWVPGSVLSYPDPGSNGLFAWTTSPSRLADVS